MTDTTTFGSLRIDFDDRVLRPRAWTTAQSEWAAELLSGLPDGPVLELCAGAGQIGLLAVLDSERDLVTVDVNAVACDFTLANAQSAGLAERVQVRNARLESALAPDETFAMIIADPPWVRRLDTGQFPEDPLTAIDGGDDGLDVARACLEVIRRHLAPRGSAIVQLGTPDQADALGMTEPVGDDLHLVEVRRHERGVLVRFDRGPCGDL